MQRPFVILAIPAVIYHTHDLRVATTLERILL
jgi:hypothetical protein